MKGRVRVFVLALVAACVVLAVLTPLAAATLWNVYKPLAYAPMGHVEPVSATVFRVTDSTGARVGRVVKTDSGAWKVMRGSTKIAVARANGTEEWPVNLYNAAGKRVGCAGRHDGRWRVAKLVPIIDDYYGLVMRGTVSKGCPGRAAAGAARLLCWK